MRDVDDALAILDQHADDREQALYFGGSQRCRGFIHDDELCISEQSFGDFDQLLLRDAQGGHRFRHIYPQPQFLENSCGLLVLAAALQHAQACFFAAQKDVVHDAEGRYQLQLLVNQADP